ncbi:AraC family transcriptional regulator [Chitinophaga sp.]|uniref:AraC family transcriptional regulator n=1 Tax=Chitinophaga sp. TaxID=1869181 RepID=UPI0031D07B25
MAADLPEHNMITKYDFFRRKYGEELLIDLVGLQDLERYIKVSPVQRLAYYDITFIVDGQGSFFVDSQLYPLSPGSAFFSSPGQIREWGVNIIPKGYALIFEEEFLCTFFNDAGFVKNLPYFGTSGLPHALLLDSDEFSRILGLLQNIRSEILEFKKNDKHILRALLYQVLVLLNRKFHSTYPSSMENRVSKYVSDFIQFVDTNHYKHRSVEYYAQQLHITSGHLNSLVKNYFGISAKKYILNRNIGEAKRMLQYTSLGVDEIAYSLNYENPTYFIRIFKEHTNFTPHQFRRQINP